MGVIYGDEEDLKKNSSRAVTAHFPSSINGSITRLTSFIFMSFSNLNVLGRIAKQQKKIIFAIFKRSLKLFSRRVKRKIN